MTTAADYAYAMTIITRFSRGDHVQWQNVAAVLGRNVEDVKREFDLAMPKIPVAEFPDDLPPEFVIVPSPRFYPRLRAKVLAFLLKGPSNPDQIGASTGMIPKAVRARLSELHAAGLVDHDGAWGRATHRTWRVTAEGKSFAAAQGFARAPSKEEQAA